MGIRRTRRNAGGKGEVEENKKLEGVVSVIGHQVGMRRGVLRLSRSKHCLIARGR